MTPKVASQVIQTGVIIESVILALVVSRVVQLVPLVALANAWHW